MEKTQGQLYKIRKGQHGEHIVHAPIEFEGWVKLTSDEKGFRYDKVVL